MRGNASPGRHSSTAPNAGASCSRSGLHRSLDLLRRLWTEQVHLQQVYAARNDFSGLDGVTATRTLRWSGDGLVGDLLPPSPSDPVGRS